MKEGQRSRRVARRVIGWTAVALVVLAVATALLVAGMSQTRHGRSWVRGIIEDVLARAVLGRVRVGSVEGGLVGRVVLRGVRIYDAAGVRVVAVERLEARYDLWPVLVGRPLRIRALAVDGLALHVVERDGRWNVAELAVASEGDDAGGAVAVTIDDLRLRDASLKMRREDAGLRLRALALDATVASLPDETRVDLRRLAFDVVGRDVAIADVAARLRMAADGALTTAGHVRTSRSALRWDVALTAGAAAGYDVTVDVDRLGAADVRALTGGALPAIDGVGRLRAHGPADHVRLHAKVATAAGDVSLRAELTDGPDAAMSTYVAHGRVRGLDVAALGVGARPTDLDATFELRGSGLTAERAEVAATVRLDGSAVGDLVVDRAEVEAVVGPARATLALRAVAAAGETRLDAALDRVAETYDATFDVRGLDLGRLLGRPALAGAVTATVVGSGRGLGATDFEARVEVAIAPSTIGEARITGGAAVVRAVPATVTIERLELDAAEARVEASGTLALPGVAGEGAAGELRLTATAADLGPLAALADRDDVAGALRIEATIAGRADDLGGRVRLEGRRLGLGETRVGELDATASARGIDTVAGPTFAPEEAEVAGTLRDVIGGGRTLATVRLTSRYDRQGAGADPVVRVALTAAEAGDGGDHELRATATVGDAATRIELERLRVQPGAAPWTLDGTPVVTVGDGGFAIERLALVSSEGSLRAEGHVAPGGNDLVLTLDGFPLAAVEPLLGDELAGTLSGAVRLGGTGAAPELTLDATVADPGVAGVGYDELRARVTMRAGRAEAEVGITEGGARRLSIEGTAPVELSLTPFVLRPGAGLRGRLEARGIELALVGPFVPAVRELGGRLEADLVATGSPAAPELRGDLRLVEGRVRVPALGVTYDPIELAVRVDGTRAVVERCDVTSGEGRLRGEGEAEIRAGVPTVNLRLELTRFPLVGSEQGHGAASGWVWLTGTPAAPVVGGSLQTEGLTLRLPEESTTHIADPDPSISVVRGPGARPDAFGLDPVPPEREPVPDAPSVYERAAMTIQIDIPRNAWLKRSDAEIELRGWATVSKKPAEPLAVAAEIDAVRGWYAFRGKRFTLVEGEVTLTGNDLDPLLELVAMHRARDYQVFVVVGGTLSDPTLRLESEPALDQADVLSVLLFGRTSAELSGGETEALQEQTVAIASSYAAQGLSQSVAGSLGLDSLQVDAVGTGGVDETEVTAGKYLADDVFVALSHRFGKETVDELRIEYQFLPEWSLETTSDTLGQSGVDVFWKRRY